MMKKRCWDRSIRGRSASLLGFLMLLLSPLLPAQTLDELVRQARTEVRPGDLATLKKLAAAHPKDQTGALALLAIGIIQQERRESAGAIESLRSACDRLPQLADYCAYYKQGAHQERGDYGAARHELSAISGMKPASPLVPRAVLGAAKADLAAQKPADAVEVLRKHFGEASDPRADLLLGAAYEAQNDPTAAAVAYQHVYFAFPMTAEAADAEAALRRIATSRQLPAPTTTQSLARAYSLLERGDPDRAKTELTALLPYLPGPDRELALVRIGAAELKLKQPADSIKTLSAVHPASPEVDGERLYILQSAAWRLDREEEALGYLTELARSYPASSWRLKALDSTGSHYLLTNDLERAAPLFRACAEASPKDSQASSCQWKYLWSQYVQRRPEAVTLLKAHLAAYPNSEKANAALYFLGRESERNGDPGTARVLYQEIATRFPNTYYAVLARELLAEPRIAKAAAPISAVEYLASIPFPNRPAQVNFRGNPATSARLTRARLLSAAGLDDLAEGELRFGASQDGQAHVMALELAENSSRRGAFDQGIRWIKRYAPDYLNMDISQAPANFWQHAFPLPYRSELEASSRSRSLDPYLVAALIRQESEFNPKVISHAKAYGLTQVLPSTGKQLSRRLGYRTFSAAMLFKPGFNMELGTYYLRSLTDSLNGRLDAALASYNAGKSRVDRWLGWNQYREPSEFIESIPFNETRNYVQIVLRNADMYRRLYAGKASLVPSPNGTFSEQERVALRHTGSTAIQE